MITMEQYEAIKEKIVELGASHLVADAALQETLIMCNASCMLGEHEQQSFESWLAAGLAPERWTYYQTKQVGIMLQYPLLWDAIQRRDAAQQRLDTVLKQFQQQEDKQA